MQNILCNFSSPLRYIIFGIEFQHSLTSNDFHKNKLHTKIFRKLKTGIRIILKQK